MHVRVAIIGAGLGGLGVAMTLRRAGIDDLVVLERRGAVGGTWRDNTYPGCACDVPSALYSYSFAPKPDWSRFYATQPEIRDYVEDVVRAEGVRELVRFGADVLEAAWSAEAQRWAISTTAGDWTADVLVSATGPWSEPEMPALPGLDGFRGRVFHSSRWDHGHDLRGAEVAVVGTGASAVQFVPAIRRDARRVTVFQRTPQWVLPKPDRRLTGAEQAVLRRVPGAQRALREGLFLAFEAVGAAMRRERAMRELQRAAELHLRLAVRDPRLRADLTPDWTLGCKRILMSNDWYRALTSDDVTLVPHGVREITPGGVVGADGVQRAADTLILGTGFKVTDAPIAQVVRGADGRTLAQAWNGHPEAYAGTTVAGFPNLFVILGPNVGNGHSSAVLLIEAQAAYVADALRVMRREGAGSVDVRPDVQARFNADVQRRLRGTVWEAGGCSSYYHDRTGRNATIFPFSVIELRRRLRRFDAGDYELAPARREVPVAA